MSNRLFIGIGVQHPKGMDKLPGVHDAVRRMAKYATDNGHFDQPILFLDEKNKAVDDNWICTELTREVLSDRPRIVLYFCGHGAFLNGSEIWYLTDGQQQWSQRVDVSALRDVLVTYGPRQLCIFSDACQTATTHFGNASAILPAAQGEPSIPKVDVFRATIEGKPAFATIEDGPLFSHCIAEALIDQPDEAFDKQYLNENRRVISSQSLGDFVEANLPDYAALVGKKQHPEIATGLRYDTNDYLELPMDPITGVAPPRDLEGISRTIARERGKRRKGKTDEIVEATESEWRQVFWEAAMRVADSETDWMGLLLHAERKPQGKLLSDTELIHSAGVSEARPVGPSQFPGAFVGFETRAGEYWEPPFRFGILRIGASYTPLQLHPMLTCIASWGSGPGVEGPAADGIQAMGWYEVDFERNRPDKRHLTDRLDPMRALKGLMTGVLGADMVDLLAAQLRIYKHADPLYGIVAAYLYDRTGDIDSVRRVCSFYRQYNQAVPFDIAMLARLPMRLVENIGLVIDVPELGIDEEARDAGMPPYVWEKMPAVDELEVAGLAPTITAGWRRLKTLSSLDLHRSLSELTPELADAPVATIRGKSAGKQLIKIYQTAFQS